MATNIPNTIPELQDWANTHSTLWQANQASIGLSTAQVAAFKALVTSFVANAVAADAARQASKNATLTLQGSVDSIRGTGGMFVNIIKAFAVSTANPAVYTLAGVSPDSPAGTVPPPVAPTNFTAAVNPNGSLTIKWKASQPAGVTNVQYLVSRRLPTDTDYTLIDTVGSSKTYTDDLLPRGVDRVDYIIQPKHGDVLGPAANVFTVQFGTVGGGGLAISSVSETPMVSKLAA